MAPSPATSVWPQSSGVTGGRLPVARLILMRHPNTMANAAFVLQGSTDSPLSSLGEQQITRLKRMISQDEPQSADHEDAAEVNHQRDDLVFWPEADLPSLIVHSPLGRCRRVAEAFSQAISERRSPKRRRTDHSTVAQLPAEDEPTASSSSSASGTALAAASSSQTSTAGPSAVSIPSMIPSHDLQEKSFGPLECTRKGVHAGPPFPKAPPGSRKETEEDFRARVRRAGRTWINKACEMGKAARATHETNTHRRSSIDSTADPRDSSVEESPLLASPAGRLDEQQQPFTPPTLLGVSHGLWLSTFFRLFLDHTHSSDPSQARPTFAHNTGMFFLEVYEPTVAVAQVSLSSNSSSSSPSRPVTRPPKIRLVRSNWTPHLVGMETQDRRAKVVVDPKQRKLHTFFSAKSQSPVKAAAEAATMTTTPGRAAPPTAAGTNGVRTAHEEIASPAAAEARCPSELQTERTAIINAEAVDQAPDPHSASRRGAAKRPREQEQAEEGYRGFGVTTRTDVGTRFSGDGKKGRNLYSREVRAGRDCEDDDDEIEDDDAVRLLQGASTP